MISKQMTVGKEPVVVVPLKEWGKIESAMEDLEMLTSVKYKNKIAKARKEKKIYSSKEVKKLLRI